MLQRRPHGDPTVLSERRYNAFTDDDMAILAIPLIGFCMFLENRGNAVLV